MIQDFVKQVKNTVAESLSQVHTAIPGTIVSVNAGAGTASVLPSMKMKTADGSTISYPQVSGVPIVLPQGNGQKTSIAYPVKAGDGCLIIVAEQSNDYWQYGIETDTDLKFDLTNSICIPGLFQSASDSFQEACEEDAVIITAGETRMIVKEDGITIEGDLKVEGEITADNL